MAEMDESQFSLMSLEDELTCSICLSTFECPVTIPCGHNFCQDCLLATWKDSYSCPQCRAYFPTRPELKKNTVLSTVVETFALRSSKSESGPFTEEKLAEEKDAIRCDTCMEAEASQTCLTCMASYCEEHLRPHRENPIFRVHQLSEPVGDLSERICPDHHKLMELFCSQHGRSICSLCLQVHKGCTLMTPDEQRSLKEEELRDKLGFLHVKIEKTENILYQMNEAQSKLKDGAGKRKAVLAAVYQQTRDALAQEERNATVEVDCELESGQAKLRELMKRLDDNTEIMKKAREDINSLLSRSQTATFLQASYDLPKIVKFEPHMSQINLDSKKITATQDFASALKEHLTEILRQPVEARLQIMSPCECPELNTDITAAGKKASASEPEITNSTGPKSEPEQQERPEQKMQARSHNPGPPPIQTYFQPIPVPVFSYMGSQASWDPSWYRIGVSPGFSKAPLFKAAQKTDQGKKQPSAPSGHTPRTTGSHCTKNDKPKTHPPPHQGKKQPSAPSGHTPRTTGSHCTKNDKPQTHPPPRADPGEM